MKLATLRTGGRDGVLVVVDERLGVAAPVPHTAATLIEALEDWDKVEPRLREAAEALEAGAMSGARPFTPKTLAAPLPRSPQFLDGSVYLRHMEKARKARGAAMPPNYQTEPIMYQGVSDDFLGPHQPMTLADEAYGLDYEPEIAVVVDDVPLGTSVADAASHIKLVMLLNDYTLRALTQSELPKGFGFVQAKPTSSFAPVAVPPEDLGSAWDGERFHLRVRSGVNGVRLGDADAGRDMFFTYPQLIAHAARTRRLSAGTVIGAGSISNDDEASGHGCLAEARIAEEVEFGAPRTSWLRFGDEVWMDAVDQNGDSVFGSIRQSVVGPAETTNLLS
jgi:fumarylacetoacetate (FAA) hydrolase